MQVPAPFRHLSAILASNWRKVLLGLIAAIFFIPVETWWGQEGAPGVLATLGRPGVLTSAVTFIVKYALWLAVAAGFVALGYSFKHRTAIAGAAPSKSERMASDLDPVGAGQELPAAPLTYDQLEFRKQLKQFALVYPEKLANAITRARHALIQAAKGVATKDERYLYPLFQANHNFQGATRQLEQIRAAARSDTAAIDVEALLRLLSGFLGDYRWEMKYIANLMPVADVVLDENTEIVREWLLVDREFSGEWEKLRAIATDFDMKRLDVSAMASNSRNWTERFKVNW